jgi:hypothetical protein
MGFLFVRSSLCRNDNHLACQKGVDPACFFPICIYGLTMDYLWTIYGVSMALPPGCFLLVLMNALYLGGAKNEQNTNLEQQILSFSNSHTTFGNDA